MSEIITKQLTKVRQQEQILYKIQTYNNLEFRAKDIAHIMNFPEPTVRRVLGIFVKQGIVTRRIISSNFTLYKLKETNP